MSTRKKRRWRKALWPLFIITVLVITAAILNNNEDRRRVAIAAFEGELRQAGYFVPVGQTTVTNGELRVTIGRCSVKPAPYAQASQASPTIIELVLPQAPTGTSRYTLGDSPELVVRYHPAHPWAGSGCLGVTPQ